MLFSGYVKSVNILLKPPTPNYYYAYSERNGYILIRYTCLDIGNVSILLIAKPDKLDEWIDIHGIKVHRVGNGSLYIGDEAFKYIDKLYSLIPILRDLGIGYILSGDGYSRWSVIIPSEIADRLGLRWDTIYEGAGGDDSIPIPSMSYLSNTVGYSLSGFIYWFSIFLDLLLVLGIPPIIFISYRGSKDFKKLVGALYRESKRNYIMLASIMTFIIVTSSILLGVSIAFILAHSTSFIAHRVFSAPYIRPSLSNVLPMLITISIVLTSISVYISSLLTIRKLGVSDESI